MFLRLVNTMILIVLAVSITAAQSIRISVFDKDDKQPISLAYVNVYAANNSLQSSYQTDASGNTTITPQNYPCVIEVVMQGYEHYRQELLTPPANTFINIAVTKNFSNLNEVVVTGLGQPVKMKNALSNYQVITKAQIQSQGAFTLNEALKNQLNMNIGSDPVLGSNMQLQGMGGDKVKILIDGMPLNGREAGNINLSQINMNNVERIEVIQGPMSVAYGADAIAGVINVITKKERKKAGISINTYYETVGKYNIDGAVTYQLKERHQFTLGGGRNYFGGYKNIDQPAWYNGDTIRTSRAFLFKPLEQYLGNFAYTYNAASGFKVRFASDYLKETVTNKGSLNAWDPWKCTAFDEYYRTTRSMNRLSAEGKLGKNGLWQSQNSLMIYNRIKNRYEIDFVTLNQDPTPKKGDQDTSSFHSYTFRGTYANTIKKIKYTVGYDANLEYAASLKIHGNYKTIQDYALFTTMSYDIMKDKLTIQGGVRKSYNNTYETPVLPSANLLYTPIKTVQVRLSYSKGFRAPSLKELYLDFNDANHNINGNPNLKPENSQHVQLSVSHQLFEESRNYAQLVFASNYNNITDGVLLVNRFPNIPNNIDYTYINITKLSNTVNSLQLDGQYEKLHFQAGVSYNYTFRANGYYDAFAVAEANVQLQYSFLKPSLNINLFYKYTGDQVLLMADDNGNAYNGGKQLSYNTLDATLSKKVLKNKLKVVAGIKNILNVERRMTSGLSTSGTHGSTVSTTGAFLPRSFFTSLHFTID